MQLECPAFENGGDIPELYSAFGAGISPPLRWWGAPRDTREFAMICEDPDAPSPKPFVHWIWYGLKADTTELGEGRRALGLITEGRNSLLQLGYTGPNPPFWDDAHRYVFRLYALDSPLVLPAGSGRKEFLRGIEGHVLDQAELVGWYQKPARQRLISGAKAAALLALPALLAWNVTRIRQRAKRREYADNVVPFRGGNTDAGSS